MDSNDPIIPQSNSYVFKLKFNGETRKYGYTGPFPTVQVYNGLFDRTSTVFSIEKNSFDLIPQAFPHLTLDTFEDFQTLVRILFEDDLLKKDNKGRWTIFFDVKLVGNQTRTSSGEVKTDKEDISDENMNKPVTPVAGVVNEGYSIPQVSFMSQVPSSHPTFPILQPNSSSSNQPQLSDLFGAPAGQSLNAGAGGGKWGLNGFESRETEEKKEGDEMTNFFEGLLKKKQSQSLLTPTQKLPGSFPIPESEKKKVEQFSSYNLPTSSSTSLNQFATAKSSPSEQQQPYIPFKPFHTSSSFQPQFHIIPPSAPPKPSIMNGGDHWLLGGEAPDVKVRIEDEMKLLGGGKPPVPPKPDGMMESFTAKPELISFLTKYGTPVSGASGQGHGNSKRVVDFNEDVEKDDSHTPVSRNTLSSAPSTTNNKLDADTLYSFFQSVPPKLTHSRSLLHPGASNELGLRKSTMYSNPHSGTNNDLGLRKSTMYSNPHPHHTSGSERRGLFRNGTTGTGTNSINRVRPATWVIGAQQDTLKQEDEKAKFENDVFESSPVAPKSLQERLKILKDNLVAEDTEKEKKVEVGVDVFEAPRKEFAEAVNVLKQEEASVVEKKKEEETVVEEKKQVDKVEGIQEIMKDFIEKFNKYVAENLGDSFADGLPVFEWKQKEVQVEEKEKEVEVPGAFKTEEVKEKETGEVHPHVWCDICLKMIQGIRHKCDDCENYDLCDACFKNKLSLHLPTHVFTSIPPPINPTNSFFPTPMRSLFGRSHLNGHRRERGSSCAANQDVPGEGPIHNASCDLCGGKIRGTRFKCIDCPDFDMCSSCYRGVKELHPRHNFVPIADPSLVNFKYLPEDTIVHPGVICDGCQGGIKGVRYKCTHEACSDFDLCAACEASPIPRHDVDHLLLKIRKPVSIQRVERGVQISRSLKSDSESGSVKNLALGAQLVDGPGNDKTLYVDVDASDIAARGIRFPAEIKVPINFVNNEPVSVPITIPAPTPISIPPTSTSVETQTSSITVQDQEEISRQSTPKVNLPPPPVISEGVKAVEVFSDHSSEVVVEVAEPKVAEEKEISRVASIQSFRSSSHLDAANAPLEASYREDVTLPDGTIVPAGALFNKTWKLINDGTRPWPVGCTLDFTGGFGSPGSFPVPPAQVGEIVEVTANDIKAPDAKGHYISFWRLVSPQGERFGHRLWIDISVEDETTPSSSIASSFIAPSLRLSGKAPTITDASVKSPTVLSVAPSVISVAKSVSTSSTVSSEEGYGKVLIDEVESTEDEGEFVLLSDDEDSDVDEEDWKRR